MTGGTQYRAQLVWKANQAMPSGNKIAAAPGATWIVTMSPSALVVTESASHGRDTPVASRHITVS